MGSKAKQINRGERWNKFCKEDISLIEGYEEMRASDKQYILHHRLETHMRDKSTGKIDIPREPKEYVERDTLKAFGLYWNRPANELIFMEYNEHSSLHIKGRGIKNGGKHKRSDKQKKYLSELWKGAHWYNNGVIEKFCHECPDGFVAGRIPYKKNLEEK